MCFDIRNGVLADFEALKAIELKAFETLRSAGAVSGVPYESSSTEDLQRFMNDGLLLVATDAAGTPVGFAGGQIVGDFIYVGEVDVHPDAQRQGLGRRLVSALLAKARSNGLAGASLTTDRLAPFNAPFYETLGFRLIEGPQRPQYLTDILKRQIGKGLDPDRRVAMQLRF